MTGLIILIVGIVCISAIVWMRQRRRMVYTEAAGSGVITPEASALKSFIHGNSCLAEGKFSEALAAFEQARAIDPKRPYVADRIAEVLRQQAAKVTPLVNAAT